MNPAPPAGGDGGGPVATRGATRPLLSPQIFYGRSADLSWQPRLGGKVLAAEMSRRGGDITRR